MCEAFLVNPEGDYTFKCFQNNSFKTGNFKQDYEDGCNYLDQWIHNKIQNNK